MSETWRLSSDLVVVRSEGARKVASSAMADSLDTGLFCGIHSLLAGAGKEAEALRAREQLRERLDLVLMVGDAEVGAFLGRHSEQNVFRMGVTVIKPDYQGHGYYKLLLAFVAKWATERGYRALDSVHNIGNSRIISTKLRQGFYITGMESRLAAGHMVRLMRFLDPKHEELFKFRAGYASPTEFVKERLPGLSDSV